MSLKLNIEVQGWVYILTNPSQPGQVKIGMTDRPDPQVRIDELNSSTSVATDFELIALWKTANALKKEQALHSHFAHCRTNLRREFFLMEPGEAVLETTKVLGPPTHCDMAYDPTRTEEYAEHLDDQAAELERRTAVLDRGCELIEISAERLLKASAASKLFRTCLKVWAAEWAAFAITFFAFAFTSQGDETPMWGIWTLMGIVTIGMLTFIGLIVTGIRSAMAKGTAKSAAAKAEAYEMANPEIHEIRSMIAFPRNATPLIRS